MSDDADRAALDRAARYIRDWLRRVTPGHHGYAWRISHPAEGVTIGNRTIPVEMMEKNKRHPLFGDRERWYHENVRHPERTGFADRAVLEAADRAEEIFADEWLDQYVAVSPYFERA